MQEIWREHSCSVKKKFLLIVSNFGERQVYSTCSNRILKRDFGGNHGAGYKVFADFLAHRVVAQLFIPGDLDKHINHIDGNKDNNHVDNLEWCTRSENLKHAYNTGLVKESDTLYYLFRLKDKSMFYSTRREILSDPQKMLGVSNSGFYRLTSYFKSKVNNVIYLGSVDNKEEAEVFMQMNTSQVSI